MEATQQAKIIEGELGKLLLVGTKFENIAPLIDWMPLQHARRRPRTRAGRAYALRRAASAPRPLPPPRFIAADWLGVDGIAAAATTAAAAAYRPSRH